MILIKFFLVHYATLIIFGKYRVRNKIRGIQLRGTKFFYNLAECLFCYTHLVGVLVGALLLPFVILSIGFSFEFLLFPVMSTGALFFIGKQIDE